MPPDDAALSPSAAVASPEAILPAASGDFTPAHLPSGVFAGLHNPYTIAELVIYAVFIVVGLLAPLITPYDPTAILMTPAGGLASNLPPGVDHLLGTTNMGRDIFSQLVMGTEPSLVVGVSAAVGIAFLGTLVGLIAGYSGGLVDAALMQLSDIVLSIPFLPFVIVLLMLAHGGTPTLVLCVVLLLWPNAARVIRSQVLTIKERPFIEAARVAAAPEWRILLLYVAPTILPLSFLYGVFGVGWAILTQAAVSFLGFGGQSISWGFMLQDAYTSEALIRGGVQLVRPARGLYRARRSRRVPADARLRKSPLSKARRLISWRSSRWKI